MYQAETFQASFWETDFLSQTGFDTLANHIKEGQKSCKWLEDYLRLRAKAEEDYGKALQKLAKSANNEFGTLQKTLEDVRKESEAEATIHLFAAAKIQEESLKLTDFRERQKEERKKQEDVVHRSHRAKADLYKRMQSCKQTYENRYKTAEKADSDVEKLKFGTKPKETEKAKKHAINCRSNAIKADEDYKNSVSSVEEARKKWVYDHAEACGEFQRMEKERIQFMRNSIWVFSNVVSDLCCQLDDSREKIRLVTEKCDEKSDIRDFVAQKSTCQNPLATVEYIPCGGSVVAHSQVSPALHNDIGSTFPATPNGANHIYEMGDEEGLQFKALYDYEPRSSDELEIQKGDRIQKIASAESGWMKACNLRTGETGLVPETYVK